MIQPSSSCFEVQMQEDVKEGDEPSESWKRDEGMMPLKGERNVKRRFLSSSQRDDVSEEKNKLSQQKIEVDCTVR
jgi:hypothetical protein